MDMTGGYNRAFREHLPHAQVTFARFHVQRLAGDAVDAVRRAEVTAHAGTGAAHAIRRSRYALLKSPSNMSRCEHQKLADIQANNQRLYRARLPGDTLADALEYRSPSGPAKRSMNGSPERVAPSSSRSSNSRARSARTNRAF
jgi:transposase